MATTPIPTDPQLPGSDPVGVELRYLFPVGVRPVLHADLPSAASYPGAFVNCSNVSPADAYGAAATEDLATGVLRLLWSDGTNWTVLNGALPA